MLIVADKNESIKCDPDLIVVDGSSQELLLDNRNNQTYYEPSEILILCIANLGRDSIKTQYLWGPDDASNIKR